jgi:hypothetical protein
LDEEEKEAAAEAVAAAAVSLGRRSRQRREKPPPLFFNKPLGRAEQAAASRQVCECARYSEAAPPHTRQARDSFR